MSRFRRRLMIACCGEEYFQFEDPEVESVVANWIGDGVGTTLSRIKSVTTIPTTIFQNNTDITTFDEFAEFTGITSLPNGSDSSNLGCFGGCTSLESIILPESITTIGTYSFYDCQNLENIQIPSNTTSVGNYSFYNCISLKSLHIPCGVSTRVFRNADTGSCTVGSYRGDLKIDGNLTGVGANSQITEFKFNRIDIVGTFQTGGSSGSSIGMKTMGSVRVGSGMYISSPYAGSYAFTQPINFIEVMGDITRYRYPQTKMTSSTVNIMHIGYNGKITSEPATICMDNIGMLYVGDGSSQANDQAILDTYLADEAWAPYASKMDIWYNYTGEYPFGPLAAEDGRIWSYYDVQTTESAIYLTYISGVTFPGNMDIDGEISVPFARSYQFSTLGNHLVKFNVNQDGSIPNNAFRIVTTITKIYVPSGISTIGQQAFRGNSACAFAVFRDVVPPALQTGYENIFNYSNYPVYVQFSEDHSILNQYKTSWSLYSSRIYELNVDHTVPTT